MALKIVLIALSFLIGGAVGASIVRYQMQPELKATNLTCEEKINSLTKEFTQVQNECNPIATSTQG